jgi:hypothetical protein
MRSGWWVVPACALAAACAGGPGGGSPHLGHEHGVEILGVQLAAGGDLARLNYRVTDYEKARKALMGEVRLLAEGGETLPVVSVGRLGPMKQRPSATGRPQFILFTNPGRALRKGGTAVVALQEGRIAGVPVS